MEGQTSTNETFSMLRGSPRSLQSDGIAPDVLNGGVCRDLQVVDACRGTGIQDIYNKRFVPYEGSCSGRFVENLPIYRSTTGYLFMYPIDVYPNTWSKEELQGLTRWRIASFHEFDDKETCRRENANVWQMDFAADGQPYKFFPTVACFDLFGNEDAGFRSSTINIRCNDVLVGNGVPSPAPAPMPRMPTAEHPTVSPDVGGGGGGLSGGGIFGIVLLVLLIVGCSGYLSFFYFRNGRFPVPSFSRRRKQNKETVFPSWGQDNDYKNKLPETVSTSSPVSSKTKTSSGEPEDVDQNDDDSLESCSSSSSGSVSIEGAMALKSEPPRLLAEPSSLRGPRDGEVRHSTASYSPLNIGAGKAPRRASLEPPGEFSSSVQQNRRSPPVGRIPAKSDDEDNDDAIPPGIRSMVSQLDEMLSRFGASNHSNDSSSKKKSKLPRTSVSRRSKSPMGKVNKTTPSSRDTNRGNRSLSPIPGSRYSRTTRADSRNRSLSPLPGLNFSARQAQNASPVISPGRRSSPDNSSSPVTPKQGLEGIPPAFRKYYEQSPYSYKPKMSPKTRDLAKSPKRSPATAKSHQYPVNRSANHKETSQRRSKSPYRNESIRRERPQRNSKSPFRSISASSNHPTGSKAEQRVRPAKGSKSPTRSISVNSYHSNGNSSGSRIRPEKRSKSPYRSISVGSSHSKGNAPKLHRGPKRRSKSPYRGISADSNHSKGSKKNSLLNEGPRFVADERRGRSKSPPKSRTNRGPGGYSNPLESAKVPDTTHIALNADGSVVVSRKKLRHDGATVTERITYSDQKMAAKHGVHI